MIQMDQLTHKRLADEFGRSLNVEGDGHVVFVITGIKLIDGDQLGGIT